MKYAYLLPTILLLAGCQLKKPAAAEERDAWIASLNDSISAYQEEKDLVQARISPAREAVGKLLRHFEFVENPREVEGYYLAEGWKDKLPLKSTGLVARMSRAGDLEMIATLTGGKFNEISASANGETIGSSVVPHDQALNYRAGNLNRVCFSGESADSICRLIAEAPGNVEITFLEGKKTGGLTLPSDQKEMIAKTWKLYNAQHNVTDLEKELPRLAGKISACRRLIDSREQEKEAEANK